MEAILNANLCKDTLKTKETPKGNFAIVENRYAQIIRQKLLSGKNWVCIFTGRTRSGKSYSSVELCRKIDPNFKIDNIVFSAQEFMSLLKSGKLEKGSMILWDEAGVGIATREWYSVLNKSINLVFQTWGYKNIGLILTVPHISFVDSQTRKLCNTHIQTLQISKQRKVVKAKIHNLAPMGANEIKRVRPRYYVNGEVLDIEYLEIPKPPAKLIHAYEKKKDEFSQNLQNSVQLELNNTSTKQKEGEIRFISDEDLLIQAWNKLKEQIVLVNGKRKVSLYEIRKELGVTVERAKFVQQNILIKSEQLNYPKFDKIDNKDEEIESGLLQDDIPINA